MTENLKSDQFDFDAHRQDAAVAYQRVRPLYEAFAAEVQRIIHQCLVSRMIQVASIDARAKTLESFGDKAASQSENNPETPRYPDPLRQITDLAGVRIIAFFLRTVAQVD